MKDNFERRCFRLLIACTFTPLSYILVLTVGAIAGIIIGVKVSLQTTLGADLTFGPADVITFNLDNCNLFVVPNTVDAYHVSVVVQRDPLIVSNIDTKFLQVNVMVGKRCEVSIHIHLK